VSGVAPREVGHLSPRLDKAALARDEATKLMERLFLFEGKHLPARAVIFSSVDSREGSGGICVRTGEALAARVSGRICLVDANLYAPSLHRLFGIENGCGLHEMALEKGPIEGWTRLVCGENLWLVTAGGPAKDSHALLASAGIRQRLSELRSAFDYVLIEAPAVTVNGTASLLGPLADGVVLIVEANATRREVARRAKESLERANVPLLGAVLNNRTFPIPDIIYRNI
jgi:Mrp family chromosome partitioning ATPase